jgi:hypothetical protein
VTSTEIIAEDKIVFNASEFTKAMQIVCQVMRDGDRTHSEGQWKAFPAEYHIARAERHLEQLRQGSQPGEDHLVHAACRLLLAITLREAS